MHDLKEMAGAIKDVLPIKDAYHDALQPSAKQLGRAGETLGMVINAVLLPIRRYVFGWQARQDQLEHDLKIKLASVPREELADQAPLHVVVPAIQAWSYSIDCEELRNMYSNLLANALIKEKQPTVHPSFVEMIKQFDPFEANLFAALAECHANPSVELRIKTQGEAGYAIHDKHFSAITIQEKRIIPKPHYWKNLERLGLIEIQYDTWLANETVYNELETHEIVVDLKEKYKALNQELECKKGAIYLTSLGIAFSEVCIKSPIGQSVI